MREMRRVNRVQNYRIVQRSKKVQSDRCKKYQRHAKGCGDSKRREGIKDMQSDDRDASEGIKDMQRDERDANREKRAKE